MPMVGNPAVEAYQILHIGFTVVPIVAGIDKFTQMLVNWDQYLAPFVARMVGGNTHGFMMIAGAIEIIVGLGVALKPKIFSWVVAAWLLGIVINLLMTGQHYDIALRDIGLCVAALALARLSSQYDHQFERRLALKPENGAGWAHGYAAATPRVTGCEAWLFSLPYGQHGRNVVEAVAALREVQHIRTPFGDDRHVSLVEAKIARRDLDRQIRAHTPALQLGRAFAAAPHPDISHLALRLH
jgi:hypothetical protein